MAVPAERAQHPGHHLIPRPASALLNRRLDRIHQVPDEAKNVRQANDECEEALLRVAGVLCDPCLPEAARTG